MLLKALMPVEHLIEILTVIFCAQSEQIRCLHLNTLSFLVLICFFPKESSQNHTNKLLSIEIKIM